MVKVNKLLKSARILLTLVAQCGTIIPAKAKQFNICQYRFGLMAQMFLPHADYKLRLLVTYPVKSFFGL